MIPRRSVAEPQDVVPPERGHRGAPDVLEADLLGKDAEVLVDRGKRVLGVVDEVHLVDGEQDLTDADQ